MFGGYVNIKHLKFSCRPMFIDNIIMNFINCIIKFTSLYHLIYFK